MAEIDCKLEIHRHGYEHVVHTLTTSRRLNSTGALTRESAELLSWGDIGVR